MNFNISKILYGLAAHSCYSGVIKGSEDAVQTEKGYLDREQYLQVSHRQQGTFSSRREAVYALFQAYLKMKQERREWDAADRYVQPRFVYGHLAVSDNI